MLELSEAPFVPDPEGRTTATWKSERVAVLNSIEGLECFRMSLPELLMWIIGVSFASLHLPS